MRKVRVLVYMNNKFQDFELAGALCAMIKSGLFELTYTSGYKSARRVTGQYGVVGFRTNPVALELLEKNFDALLIPGGQHCRSLRTDKHFAEVAKHFVVNKKWIYAICDAPNVLFHLGLLTNLTRYTSFPIEGGKFGEGRVDVPVFLDSDSLLLSARDPEAAFEFGRAIVRLARTLIYDPENEE